MKTQLKFLILSLSFITSFVFGAASNTPNVSISPTSVSIVEGTASVDLNITLSPAPNKNYVDIAYSDGCNVAGTTERIAKDVSIGTIQIPTSGLAAHTSCTITLLQTGTDGGPAQNTPVISSNNTATITITAVGDPTANDKSYTTFYETDLTGNAITDAPADSDPNSHTLTIASNTSPSHGSVNLSGDGSFTYFPAANYIGIDSFDYTITNSNGGLATATVTIEVFPPQADLGISKSGPSAVNSEAPISYGLAVSNSSSTGMTTATAVEVIDTLPSGMTFTGVNAPTGWSCNYATGTVTCTITSLPTGYSETITINATAPYVTGDITNTATISSSTQDNNPTNDSSSLVTTITDNSTDLKITKTASPNPVNTASTLVYTLGVENIGSNDATGIKVEDSLPAGLQFISVTNPGWSCSQGQLISCNYTANGGVLAASTSSGDITITVTTPPQAATVLNSATVTSTTPDSDPSNDESNVTVEVVVGQGNDGEVPMYKYLQYNVFGDMKLIGNANVNWDGTNYTGSHNPPLYNDNANMIYIDTDGDSSTFNSSSSTLNIDSNYEIIWAGLYWEGKLCDSSSSGTCLYSSNSSYNNFTKSKDKRGEVLLKTPTRDYFTVTANNIFTTNVEGDSDNVTYSAFADITPYIDTNFIGNYSVANIALSSGYSLLGGNYGGWALLFIYKDNTNTLHYKNISVFNGFDYVDDPDNPTQIGIDGFVTPLNGDVNGSVAFFAADGDPVVGGYMEMRNGKNTTYGRVSNSANPSDNVLNSTMTEFGNNINTGITKTYGVDADRLDVSSFLVNDQHDTNFKFGAGTWSYRDYYSLSMFAFATDLTTPIIDNFTKSADIIGENGVPRPAGPDEAIYPGDELLYTLIFTNSGDEIAELVEIFDDFDFDGLTPALDLDNFDASKIRLYEGADASGTEVTNNSDYDCGYDFGQRRVYCQLDEVGINETFTMQFSVTIKDPMVTNVIDKNATNTAYSMYKNPNGDNYVILESNSHGNFGGSSNSFNAGVFTTHGSSIGSMISLDAINNLYNYNVDKNITTKIVNEPFSIQLVHLDINGNYSGYEAWQGTRPMNVVLTLCNDTSGELLNDPANTAFTQGVSEIVVPNILLEKAHRNDRIKMGYIDWNTVLTWPDSDSQCVTHSQDAANLNNVPQCFNSWLHAEDVFPEEEYPYVKNTCYGEGVNSDVPSDKLAACDSNAYSHNGDVASTDIYPAKYQHSLGCYHCLTDAFSEFSKCSTDEFAARPDHFELDSNNNSFPDLLRSGLDYNLSLFALDGSYDPTHHTTAYDQIDDVLDINKTLYSSDGIIDTNNALDGNITFGSSDFNLTDGESIAPGVTGNDVVGINFNNVATVKVRIEDPDWAFVDIDDTPQDCNTTEVTIAGQTIQIEGAAFVCGETDTRFIPYEFNLTNVHLNNHAQSPLTYLSNDLNMSAHLDLTVSAMNAGGGITTNFRQDSGYYENEVNVTMRVTDWNASQVLLLSPYDSRHPDGNNEIIHDIPTAALLGFGGSDPDGTHIIPWNETNETQKLMFNYVREVHKKVNPFDINGTDINLTVASRYTGTAPEGTAIIKGSAVGDRNATFYYARSRSAQYFYEDIAGLSVRTPVAIDVYCDYSYSRCSDEYDIDTVNAHINEADWWLSLNHDMSRNDGNISIRIGGLIEGSGAPTLQRDGGAEVASLDVNITSTSNGVDNNITVVANANQAQRPMTVPIELVTTNPTDTSSWVIYNPYTDALLQAPPSPFYKVRFINTSGWTGVGKTGSVVDTNASSQKTKRLDW